MVLKSNNDSKRVESEKAPLMQQVEIRSVPCILVVDDSPSVLKLLQTILVRHEYDVHTLVDSTTALTMTYKLLPDLILLDVDMPEMNGFEVCSQLKAEPALCEIPVIFLTGRSDLADKVHGFKVGGSDFLVKPAAPAELLARVSTHVELRQAQLELANKNILLKEQFVEIEQANIALLEREADLLLAHTVFENSSEAVMVSDADNKIIMINPAFEKVTGYERKDVIGQDPSILKSGHHDKAFYQTLWKQLVEKNTWQGEIWNRRRNGELYPQWISIAIIRNQENNIINYVAVFSDITERKKAEDILRHQAMHDPLTGLPNRVMFDKHLRTSLARARRYNTLFGLLYIDLDGFKEINDNLGHIFGDKILQLVGTGLRDCVREEDTVARLGGDEFAAILGDVQNREEVVRTAERILSCFKKTDCPTGKLILSASIGISIFPDHGDDAEELLRRADDAMYTAKRLGKGRCYCSD